MPAPIALIAPSPLTFHGVKLAPLMKNRPTIDMKTSATNLRIVVIIWTEPMFFTPDRLMIAGIHRPISTSRTVAFQPWLILFSVIDGDSLSPIRGEQDGHHLPGYEGVST